MKSPFKFLDSFTKEDREIFFGREKEIEELYRRAFRGKIMLVYGVSGTGKSSLINCGLANKFRDEDWLPVNVRRGSNILESMYAAIVAASLTPRTQYLASEAQFRKHVKALYLDHYKPVYFIFDQFEELFIFGSREEKSLFVRVIKNLVDSDILCRFIFVMREEYMASVTEFEKHIPAFFSNRVRIENMDINNAVQAIKGPCNVANIKIEEGFPEALVETLSPGSPDIELTYLQLFLDRVYRLSMEESGTPEIEDWSISFTLDQLRKVGNVSDLLGTFLNEQISLLTDPDTALAVLKSFVSIKGTKKQMTLAEVKEYSQTLGKPISESDLLEMLQNFVHLRILRDKDQHERYELRHDSLATKIFEKISVVEKDILEIRQFIEDGYHNWQKRGVLLNASDLDYVAPYESRLYLMEEIKGFIERCKNELIRIRNRRRKIVATAGILSILILSAFTIWAIIERSKATKLKVKALAEKYNFLATNVAVDDPTKGILLAEYAYTLDTTNKTILSNINKIYYYNVLYSVITKYNKGVFGIAFSPDGREILSRSDGYVRLSDQNGNKIRDFIGPYGNEFSGAVAFSPDGQKLLSSTAGSEARIWDRQGNVIADLKGSEGSIWSAVFSPDGNSVLTGSNDGIARLWDLQGNIIQVFRGERGTVRSVAFSSDGKLILTGTQVWGSTSLNQSLENKAAILWDLKGNIIRVFKCPFSLLSAGISPDGQYIITTGHIFSGSSAAILWDKNGNNIHTFTGFKRYAWSGTFSPDGRRILISSPGDPVKIFDLKGNEIQSLKGDMVNPSRFSPDGKKILTGDYTGAAIIWDYQDNLISDLSPNAESHTVEFSPDGKHFLTNSEGKTVKLWDLQGNVIQIFKGYSRNINDLKFSPNGLNILTASFDTLRLWDLNGNELMVLKGIIVRNVGFSPDGQNIIASSQMAPVGLTIWDLNGKLIKNIRDIKGSVRSFTYSPDGRKILTGGSDGAARLIDLEGNIIHVYKGNPGIIVSVAFSPDGHFILTGSTDKTVTIWDLQGNRIRVLKLPDEASSVAWSPDGTKILTGSHDMIVRLWDAKGNIIQIFKDVEGLVQDVAFSPDGQKILYCSERREFCLHTLKMPYTEYKNTNDARLSAGDKIKYGIYSCKDVINSSDVKELADAADYYTYEATLSGKNQELEYLDYAIILYKKLINTYPDRLEYILNLIKTYINYFEVDPKDETIKEIETLNQKVLSFTTTDDLFLSAFFYGRLYLESDSLNNRFRISECFMQDCDRILNSPNIEEKRKVDIGNWCLQLSYRLFDKQDYKVLLKVLQMEQKIDSTEITVQELLPFAYLFNDQYDQAEKIFNMNKNKIRFGNYTFGRGYLSMINYLESQKIIHPDFEKVRELLKK